MTGQRLLFTVPAGVKSVTLEVTIRVLPQGETTPRLPQRTGHVTRAVYDWLVAHPGPRTLPAIVRGVTKNTKIPDPYHAISSALQVLKNTSLSRSALVRLSDRGVYEAICSDKDESLQAEVEDPQRDEPEEC